MADSPQHHHPCRCQNPTAGLSDRELFWGPWLVLVPLAVALDAVLNPASGTGVLVVAWAVVLVLSPSWLLFWRACRRERRWRRTARERGTPDEHPPLSA